jgi:hypothetical protein
MPVTNPTTTARRMHAVRDARTSAPSNARASRKPSSVYSVRCASLSALAQSSGGRRFATEDRLKISVTYARTGSQYRRNVARKDGFRASAALRPRPTIALTMPGPAP